MPQTKKVIEHIASMMSAIKLCQERAERPQGGSAESWARRHGAALSELLKDTLPSGSGFDSNISLNYDATDLEKELFVFDCPFHVMDENGSYAGWAVYQVSVTPSFVTGVSLDIVQTESCDGIWYDLADYICETMHAALTAEFAIPSHYYQDI